LIALATLVLAAAGFAATLALVKRKLSRLAQRAPEIQVLCQGLIDDPRVLPHHRLVLRALNRYLDLPLDLIPDFIPLIGRLDDALIPALVIRAAMRFATPELLPEHWPGPQPPPKALLRRAGGRMRAGNVFASAA